jgi:hypothetical protein
MALWIQHNLTWILGVVTVVPCIAGEAEMDQGSSAAHIEFLNSNCSDWVETDRAKPISFAEKLKQIPIGKAANDAAWAYRITTKINKKMLAKDDPGRRKIMCTTSVSMLTNMMKDAAPFRIKEEE